MRSLLVRNEVVLRFSKCITFKRSF